MLYINIARECHGPEELAVKGPDSAFVSQQGHTDVRREPVLIQGFPPHAEALYKIDKIEGGGKSSSPLCNMGNWGKRAKLL